MEVTNVSTINLFLVLLGKQRKVSGERRFMLGSCVSKLEDDAEFRNGLIELLQKTKERYKREL